MPRTIAGLTLSLEDILKTMGENIKLARLRRKITMVMLAERAGIGRVTLRKIENGDSGVTLGAYASVLFCLGLEKDLLLIGRDDPLGRRLQDAELTQAKKRVPKRKKYE
ncbi:MAG TPA: transcriptional regulator [Deferribacteraceae bacterium]|jgi:transcriptional regulator with XRE-family HTH domain|nr:transcriptional regulator [Deferribacteraceae bacterium]